MRIEEGPRIHLTVAIARRALLTNKDAAVSTSLEASGYIGDQTNVIKGNHPLVEVCSKNSTGSAISPHLPPR
jgi:hypothetical protein